MHYKDKNPKNEKEQRHGYWETYFPSGQIWRKGLYINGQRDGLHESYWSTGRLHYKGRFINDENYGYWENYFSEDEIIKQYYAK
jgi:antitoxin component YwqK of YwqJK toxin-antitoxin module